MVAMKMQVRKSSIRLHASPKAVITRMLSLNDSRIEHVVKRIQSLTEEDAALFYQRVLQDFAVRHRDIERTFREHFSIIAAKHSSITSLFSESKKMLTGAMFTMEYSIKAAALFNPSIVPHPDQLGLQPGEKRFIMSLRAVGEGHVSSIIFQTGILNSAGEIQLDEEPNFFTRLEHAAGSDSDDADYEVAPPVSMPINEKVIFPVSKSECMGMEDARFVMFEDEGRVCYYGSYTAYDGHNIQTKLIETRDFNSFKIRALKGAAIADKGMALFPEKVNGKYVMISRQGGEMINIMFSENLYTWEKFELLMEPLHIWEMLQLGNCGSPVKTEKGWLLLTHGVGPMRTYVISAIMLDLHDPTKIIGRLNKPIISADEEEREGYVPNVVYTCGLILHENILCIPYAVSDSATGFVTILLPDLLNEMNL